MKLNGISNSIEKNARKIISGMKKGDALLPVILLELAVTGGRTYHAYQRGGFVEARERGTEETIGAIFWFWGVQMFNKLGDFVGKKILRLDGVEINKDKDGKSSLLGLEKIKFDVGKDHARDSLKNYIEMVKKQIPKLEQKGMKIPKISEKTLAVFKFTKVAASIILSNAVIGFVVPKLNQAITKNYQTSIKNLDAKKAEENKATLMKNADNFDKFANKTKEKKDTTFQGAGGIQSLLTVSHYLENDNRCKLLSSDVGIAGGRAINARNEHERREVLFRDLSSIYFYMFCKNHLDSGLNMLTTGRASRLDPTSVEILDNHLKEKLILTKENNKNYDATEFEKLIFGEDISVPENIQKEFKDKNSIITLDNFKKLSGNSKYNEIAEKMSKLQPQIESVSILTKEQVQDVYKGGLINDPEMLSKVFEKYSGGKSNNPVAYYPEKDLRNLKQRMHDYVGDIIKKAKNKGQNIDFNTLKKANKMNLIHNGLNLAAGFAVSAYFLSTAIPKIQYWITQRKTGQNSFPGIQEYDKQTVNKN